ncbi:DUF4434 domain-containing protein [Desulfonatronum sp. SC1]|uniref:DUF4434 domain-containing protein n=1 Tax=Desulfonatronum sp. SC1 TaxID=2109626 RepID=UPI000D2FA3E2|nr:DUF4434 domain-containing protein [Desulfonatronum sp. SC1]PTN37505.1 hypothetical protein C6366_05965 [Desulfonatronum sp. SC1]
MTKLTPFSRHCSSGSRLRAAWWALLACLALAWGALPVRAETPPAFSSTFIQIWDRHDDWTEQNWDTLCADLKAMGIREIILQWSLITEPAFFWRLTPDRRMDVPNDRVDPAPVVDLIVEAARRHGLSVRFGLSEDPAWWEKIKNEAGLVEVFLNRLLQDQISLARTLVERYGEEPIFAGFYIPQEIDDATWIDAERLNRLSNHLTRLVDGLRELSPEVEISVSCFATGRNDPMGFAALMADLALSGNITEVLYQDGLGTERLLPSESAAYLEALAASMPRTGARLRVIVETFAPAEDGLDFVPAPINRIKQQLLQAQTLVSNDIIAFSIPDYLHPMAGPQAKTLHDDYQRYLDAQQPN